MMEIDIINRIIKSASRGSIEFKLTVFFGIIFFTLIFKNIFTKIILKLVKKITSKTKTNIDDLLINASEKPLVFGILITGIFLSTKVFRISSDWKRFNVTLYQSLLIIAVFWALIRAESIYTKFIEKILKQKGLELAVDFLPLMSKLIRISLIVISFTIIIQAWGYNIGAIITGLGIGGLAVALAAKDTIANLFATLSIVLDRPFNYGDYVLVSGIEGTVEEIGFRHTKIRTLEKTVVLIPNSNIASGIITNFTRREQRRIKHELGIEYSTNRGHLENAISELRNYLLSNDMVDSEQILLSFTEFGDSSLKIFLHCYVKTSKWDEYLQIKQDINIKIMEIFEKYSIKFAFPSMTLYKNN